MRTGSAGERIAKALARAGVASRREVERLIAEGRVAVNGRPLESPAVRVSADDLLTVDGKLVSEREAARLWRYHKPVGLVTTHSDPRGRPTVFENLPDALPRVLSVGRLDLNSEGLLLLTNDGELARALELPTTGLVRRYRARAYGGADQTRLDRLKDGVVIDGVAYGAIEARLDKAKGGDEDGRGPRNLWITVTLAEGRNREVRRVLESVGLKVNRLIRLSYGPFSLGSLERGAVEEVGPRVIRELLADYIAPENLPKGDRTHAPIAAKTPTAAGRRALSQGSKPQGLRQGAKASGARASAADAEGPQRLVRKPGWAKPKKRARPVKSASGPGERKTSATEATPVRPPRRPRPGGGRR